MRDLNNWKEVSPIVDVPGHGVVWLSGGKAQNILGEELPREVALEAALLWLTEGWDEPYKSKWRELLPSRQGEGGDK